MSSGLLFRGAALVVFACTVVSLPAGQLRADEIDTFAKRAEAALSKKSHFTFEDTELKDVGEAFAAQLALPVILDQRALDDAGIGLDTPISGKLSGVSLRSALRLTLKDLDLTYVFRDGALVITTPEEAESRLVTKFFEVDRLARMRNGTYDPLVTDLPYDFDSIIDIISTSISPDSWDEVGGPGSIDILGTKLVISQTNDVHKQIAELLKALSTAFDASAKVSPGKPPRAVSYLAEDPRAILKIERSLNTTFNFEFENAELIDVINALQKRVKFNIEIDVSALEDIGLGTDTPINFKAQGMSLGNGLRHMLGQFNLAYFISDESLIISTLDEVDYSNRRVRIYPVGDLVFVVEGQAPGYDGLTSAIITSIAPQTWTDVGGSGSIGIHWNTKSLIIATSDEVHSRVGRLLEKLRGRSDDAKVQQVKRVSTVRIVEPAKNSADDPFDDNEDPFGSPPDDGSDASKDPFQGDSQGKDPFKSSGDATSVIETLSPVFHGNVYSSPFSSTRTTRLGSVPAPVWIHPPVAQLTVIPVVGTVESENDLKRENDAKKRRPGGKKPQSQKGKAKKLDAKNDDATVDDATVDDEGYSRRVYFISPSGSRLHQGFGGTVYRNVVPVVGQLLPVVEQPKTNAVTLNQFGGGNQPGGGGGGFGGGGGGGGGGVTVNQFSIHNDPKIPTDDIAELLQELVVPKSWESEDAYVRALPGRLVIRQTVENHRAIIDFLKDLAVYRGLSPHESAKSISNPGYSGGGIRGSFGGGGGAQGGFFTVPDGKSNQK